MLTQHNTNVFTDFPTCWVLNRAWNFFISSNIWNVLRCSSGPTHILKLKESGPFTLCYQFSCDSSYSKQLSEAFWRSLQWSSSLSPTRPSASSVTGPETLTSREIDFCNSKAQKEGPALNLLSSAVSIFFCLRQLGFSYQIGIARCGKLLSVLMGDLFFSLKPHLPLWFKNRIEPCKLSIILGFRRGHWIVKASRLVQILQQWCKACWFSFTSKLLILVL